ncbi:MAG TPA: zinc-binding dehydrogenase [Pseudomonadales bacterium]|nr:zinc-binding dehydrogenase [Pseudomonadales bacterium]
MQAVRMTGFGGIDVLQFGEVPAPYAKPGHVLVRVEAVGTNYYDTLVRSGAVSRSLPLPHVIGSDIVGRIEQLGAGVQSFAPGDRVIVAPGFPSDPKEWDVTPENEAPSYFPTGTYGWGGYAQYVEVPARWVIPNDIDLAPEELATMPLVLVTAVHAVKTLGGVGPGSRVLVQAGASGSGSMAIQVAKALGAHVVTTVSTYEKATLAHSVGADEVIRYKETNVAEAVRAWAGPGGIDVVIDPVGGTTLATSLDCLKPRGTLVNFGLSGGAEATIPHLYPFFRNERRIVGAWMGSMAELRFGLDLVKRARIRPALHVALPLSRAREAHSMMARAEVVGKLALLPWVL